MTIYYNTEFKRWEVYAEMPPVRNGKAQPMFVADNLAACEEYIRKVGVLSGKN
jgi:hypothetical protein